MPAFWHWFVAAGTIIFVIWCVWLISWSAKQGPQNKGDEELVGHRVEEGTDYPAILITGAANDARTDPIHAVKFMAAVRAADDGVELQRPRRPGRGVCPQRTHAAVGDRPDQVVQHLDPV